MRIETYADDLDYENGHGTHVSGIAAGNTYRTKDLCGISQYNGVDSGAKIYFSDIGYSGIVGDMSEDINLRRQAKLLYEQDAYLTYRRTVGVTTHLQMNTFIITIKVHTIIQTILICLLQEE